MDPVLNKSTIYMISNAQSQGLDIWLFFTQSILVKSCQTNDPGMDGS